LEDLGVDGRIYFFEKAKIYDKMKVTVRRAEGLYNPACKPN
jgi:hypothetical protein